MKFAPSLICAATLLAMAHAHAAEPEQYLQRCAALGDASARLGCYDALAKELVKAEQTVGVPASASPEAANAVAAAMPSRPSAKVLAPATPISRMSQDWELNNDANRGVYAVRPFRDNYLLLANQSNSTNDRPYRGFVAEGYQAKHVELTYQLSFKSKLIEGIAGSPIDLWAGYTQQSFWQAYARKYSSPFRETNYQPEIMAVLPINKQLGPVNIRFVSLGASHQSNGQGLTLSRSWNRAYAALGLESGDLQVTTRVWKRLDNAKSDNDNLDITDFMGHGDMKVVYYNRGYEYSALVRRNFSTGHGALQVGVSIPIVTNLKGYVQGFTGYGQSLIDYNYAQKSLGAGVLLDF
ncbi:phospholipase A [Massilia sp. DWR3-1-1]|uniref:phospholipase A n=1 Tax=Massilia sp. DWR3-1-1 TaxID=2804559 RepID=UPI003CEF4F63